MGYKLSDARNAFESVLDLDSANAAATDDQIAVAALENIAEEVKIIRALETSGDHEELALRRRLAAEYQHNPFIRSQSASLEARIIAQDFRHSSMSLLRPNKRATSARGYYLDAIAMKSPKEQARLVELKKI